jgi:RNase P subunit RPR2
MNITNFYGDPLISMTTLLTLSQLAKRKFNALPQEEQQCIITEREAMEEQRRIKKCIQQGICPNCSSKLIRGKRDKKNNYLRIWKCLKCDKEFNQ